MFENPRRQASKKFYNKCFENSRSQIVFRTDIFRKLTLGAADNRPIYATNAHSDVRKRRLENGIPCPRVMFTSVRSAFYKIKFLRNIILKIEEY